MSRAVMQQALEALEGVAQWVEKRPDTHPWDAWQRIDPAIAALRQALAEPDYWQEEARRYAGNADYWRERYKALAEPEQEPVAIKWTLNGDKHCGYSNWLGETPFGRILITWKSWKELSDACVDEFPGGFWAYGEPDEVKAQCEAEFCRRLGTAPTPQREHITDGSPCWCNPDVIEEEGGNVIVHNYDDNWQQYAKPGETAQQCIERHRGEQDALMKLYATPRKPLTDEEISELLTLHHGWLELARAVERAHGIGEQHE